ncbi:MAG TPA: A24 family peptidase [Terracidiphilus sp.]|jgi:prepilin peptidase CpaA|nr:A24 family peptidase [Terracidiphilus sp.]
MAGKRGLKLHSIAWWPTVAVLAISTFTDLRSRRIPNWLVFPFLAAGVALSFAPRSWHGIGVAQSLEGMGLGFLLFGVLAWMGGMGMGDVKLSAAIGAWVGPQQLFLALIITGIAGGIMAVIWAALGGFLGELFTGSGDLLFGWRKRGIRVDPALTLANPKAHKMPYAPAIAIGTLMSFFAFVR